MWKLECFAKAHLRNCLWFLKGLQCNANTILPPDMLLGCSQAMEVYTVGSCPPQQLHGCTKLNVNHGSSFTIHTVTQILSNNYKLTRNGWIYTDLILFLKALTASFLGLRRLVNTMLHWWHSETPPAFLLNVFLLRSRLKHLMYLKKEWQ